MGPKGPKGAFSPDPLKSQGDNSAHGKWAPEWAPMGPMWAPVGPSVGPSGPLWARRCDAFHRSLAAVETWDGPRRAGAARAGWAPAAGARGLGKSTTTAANIDRGSPPRATELGGGARCPIAGSGSEIGLWLCWGKGALNSMTKSSECLDGGTGMGDHKGRRGRRAGRVPHAGNSP